MTSRSFRVALFQRFSVNPGENKRSRSKRFSSPTQRGRSPVCARRTRTHTSS